MDIIKFKDLELGKVFTEAMPRGKNLWEQGTIKMVKIKDEQAALLFTPTFKDYIPGNADIVPLT